MTEIEEEKAIIDGLLKHKSYRVIGQQIGWCAFTVYDRVEKLRHQYGASDRYALEAKLRLERE